MTSTSSTDAIAGFVLESVLGSGPRGVVYAARQERLGRRVALKLYAEGPLGPWPEHAGVAKLYVTGTAPDGSPFTAAQLVTGGSLAERLAAASVSRSEALALCDQVEATLAETGLAHGMVTAGNVLVSADGQALLCDFGMPGVDASAEADRAALARLRERCAALPRRRRPRLLALVAAAAVVGAVALVWPRAGGPPRPLPGTTVLGSELRGGSVRTVVCEAACTIAPIRVPRAGVVRRWAVRGARGDVSLQVVRPASRGYVSAALSQVEHAGGDDVNAFLTDLAVRRGDLLGLKLPPGTGFGVGPGRAGTARRFVGVLAFSPDHGARYRGGAVQLRVEYIPGGHPRRPPTLSGEAARRAPAGQVLSQLDAQLPGGVIRTLAVVRLRDTVALDLLRDKLRLVRITITGADPHGSLEALVRFSDEELYILRWRNPGGRELVHHYRPSARRLEQLD